MLPRAFTGGGTGGVLPSVAVAALSIDWRTGSLFTKTIVANSVFTFANISNGQTITVKITAGVGNTVTWPVVLWPGGVVPVQTSSGTDIYTFVSFDGVNIFGTYAQAMA